MKKILTHLTGIVFLITILIAGGCTAPGASPSENRGKVKIYCKAIEEDGGLHFEMSDSNDGTIVVARLINDTLVANHTVDVLPGTKVIWIWTNDSEIKDFVKIGPKHYGNIIDKDAKKIPLTKKFRLKIPSNAPIPSPEEKYDIKFLDKDNNPIRIDPYLRIR